MGTRQLFRQQANATDLFMAQTLKSQPLTLND
jgi:hypothetical protein